MTGTAFRSTTTESKQGRASGEVRLSLTSRAPEVLRKHAWRGGIRISVLVAADVATLFALWPLFWSGSFRIPMLQLISAVVIALWTCGAYGAGDQRRDVGGLIRASSLGTGLAMWSVLWTGNFLVVLPGLIARAIAIAAAILVERKLVDLVVHTARPEEGRVVRAAVIGSSDQAARLIDHPAFGDNPWCHLVAFFDPAQADAKPAEALASLIRERRIDTVILAGRLSGRSFATVLDVATSSGCKVFSLPRVRPSSLLDPLVVWRNGYPVFELTHPALMGARLLAKRTIDLVGAATALIIAAPVMLTIAAAIWLESGRPILFRQTRIGQGGNRFTILKFRTMVADAERQREALAASSLYSDGRLFKMVADPRVTRLGRFLRKTSLDELPQLFNVLLGDMSLVGPRPPLPSEVQLYEGHHYARFDVKPGITGPWQVSGRNSIRDFEQVIRLETAYIRRWSIWLDLELLLRTVPVVLSRRGAH